jgi:hypothetical protein
MKLISPIVSDMPNNGILQNTPLRERSSAQFWALLYPQHWDQTTAATPERP